MNKNDLLIKLVPEPLDESSDHEKAAFGQLIISAGDRMLAALVEEDGYSRNYQPGPFASGYHLAEWLAWNWWRLRWEPRSSSSSTPTYEWDMAHRMSDVGEGYLWPNITISCDGFQCELISERSHEADTPLFSYIGAQTIIVPAMAYEKAVDEFVTFVLQRLKDASIANTNLQMLWDDLTNERNDPEQAQFRRVEALLGFEPDQADEQRIQTWLKDTDLLGSTALDELATGAAKNMLSAKQIMDITSTAGFHLNTDCAIRLHHPPETHWGQVAAWRIGVATAKAVRTQVGLPEEPISNEFLADIAGLSVKAITSEQCTNSMSWMLHHSDAPTRIALRQSRETARRFDVSRLIGDRLLNENSFDVAEPLSPATRSYSYRQKAQRAFAAELLSPWEAVSAMLEDDYSQENQEYVAEEFGVSPLTISTLLINNEGYSSVLQEQTTHE